MDRVRSLQKILTRLRGMNVCTSWARFAPSYVRQPNGPQCTQIVRNAPKREFRVNGVDQVRLLQKIPTRLHGTNFSTNSARFAPSFVRQPNGPECTQIVRNAPKCQFWVQWGRLGAFVVTEFRKATKRSRMHLNSTKRIKTSVYGAMGWIGRLVAKNSDATSWHKLLH